MIHGFIEDRGLFDAIDAPFSGVFETQATGISNRGQIVGFFDDLSGAHGFRLDKHGFTRLDASFPDVNSTIPTGINDHGEVIGLYDTSGTDGQIFSFIATLM